MPVEPIKKNIRAEVITFSAEFDNGNSGTSTTIDWAVAQKQKLTLNNVGADVTLSPPPGPCNLVLRVVQDGSGNKTIDWVTAVKWPGGMAPTLSTAAGAIDIVSFYYDGSTYYGVASYNFS